MCPPADVAATRPPAARRTPLALLLAAACAAVPACGGDDDDDGDDAPDADVPGADAAPEEDAGVQPFGPSCEGASGARLRQVLRQHGDGTSEFLRLLDTDFDEECRFAPAGDGALRCLPVADGTPFIDVAVRYSDDACTAPFAQIVGALGDPLPTYARESVAPADSCSAATSRFHQLGGRLEILPETIIFLLDGGVCTGFVAGTADFFALGAEVALEAFVEGTESYSDSGRLGVRQVDGDDGARFCDVTAPLRDAELDGRPCTLQLAEDGSRRCLPNDVGPVSLFEDAACTVPREVVLFGECTPDAAYVGDPAGGACALRRRIRTVRDPIDPIYELVAKVCQAVPSPPTAREIGATVSPFSFAGITEEPGDAGGDRLQRRDLVTVDGFRASLFEWIDTDLEVPCAFRRAADGDQRCLPIESPLELTARVVTRFTDAACTVPITVATRDVTCLAGEPRYLIEGIGGGQTRVREVGAVQPGPLFRLGATCDPEPDDAVFYLPGDEILAQSFVGGTEILE